MASNKKPSKDITPEKLLKELTKGKGNVAQLVRRPDGAEHELAMWGYAGKIDGLDHTLNVYMNMEDCSFLSEAYFKDKYDVTGIADPCENRYVMTVDFLDIASVAVLVVDDDKVYFDIYSRDMARSFSNRKTSFSCDLDDIEGLKSNPLLLVKFKSEKASLFIFPLIALRKYLLSKGIVQQLYDMYDSTAGAVVKIGKNNRISATVVKGDKRPDLPCETILGTQNTRPYLDEVLGIKPKLVKRPKADAKVIEKKRAAKEAKEKDDFLKGAGKKYMNFRVSDDVDELENYISLFDRIVDKEIDKTNKTILKEKDTPITRANDSRIKKIYANTEEVIKKNTDKLGEVLDTLDRIGETLRESGAPDADIIRIADLIGEGKDQLKVEKSVEVYKEKKEFKSNIDKKYSSMAGKWKKIRNNLPTVKIQELTEEVEKTEADLTPLRKQIGIEKRKKTNLENKVAEINADLEGKRDELTDVSAEVSARVEASDRMQNELKQQISELTEACKTFTGETDSMIAALNELKSDYTDTIEPLRSAREAESQTLRQLETELNSIKMEESVKQKKAEKAFLFKKRKQAEYDEVHGKATSKSNQVNSAKVKLAKLDLEIARTDSDWRGRITQAEKDLAAKQTQLASAKEELGTTREKLSSEKERIKPDKDRLTAAKDSVKEAEALLKEKTKDLQTVTEQLSRDEETRDTGTARVDELKKQIRELNTAVKEDGKKTSQIVHVDEQMDVAQTPAPRSGEDFGLSYSEGLVAHGSNYRIDIPDGFVIKKNAEGRAFIAYRPYENDPDSIIMSDFVIYDGQDLGVGGMLPSLKVPAEFMSVMQQMSGLFGIVADNSRTVRILRDDLPGGLLIEFDEGAIHVNALLAVADGFKMMRLQFSCKDESRYEEYVQISKEVFDHMTVDNPVVLLDRPDDSRFVSMKLASDSVTEWTALLDEYKEHLINARNTEQDSLVAVLQKKQGISLEDAKQEIRGMLVDHITYIDRVLCRAEALYVLKKAQYPDKKSELDTMAESLGKIVELTSQHANINGERIEYTSEFGKKVKKRMKDDTVAVVRYILSESEHMLTPELVDSLRKIAGNEDEGIEANVKSSRISRVKNAMPGQGASKRTGNNKSRNSIDEQSLDETFGDLNNLLGDHVQSGGNGKMNNSQCKECYWYDGKDLIKYPEACDRYEDIKSTVVVGSSSACPYFWSKADQEAFENGIEDV